jgi:integron integrase
MVDGSANPRPRLLDQVREAIRVRHYSYRTEQQYVAWIRRFVLFHDKRHPMTMGGPEVTEFLTHLAADRNVAASTQNQALAALLFLYRNVLGIDLPWLDQVVRSKRPRRLPVVLSRSEVRDILNRLSGQYWLVASLLYGSGLRLLEALHLRVKDVDLQQRTLVVRDAKGQKDRVTVLPDSLLEPLRGQLNTVRLAHERAIAAGFGGVELPHSLQRKYSRAHLDLGWQYVFPSDRPSRDPRSGTWRRHHLYEDSVQRQVREAIRAAGIQKPASCHTLRHSFATHLLESGTTSAQCRSCSVTAMCARRRSTRMCSTAADARCAARSTWPELSTVRSGQPGATLHGLSASSAGVTQ